MGKKVFIVIDQDNKCKAHSTVPDTVVYSVVVVIICSNTKPKMLPLVYRVGRPEDRYGIGKLLCRIITKTISLSGMGIRMVSSLWDIRMKG